MNYNTLLVKYKNSWQLRTYDFPIKSSKDNELDKYDVGVAGKSFEKTENEIDKYDVGVAGKSFEKTENEIDTAFSVVDEKYHFEGHSAYVSLNRSKNKIFYYARSNDWTDGYFCTLTFDPKIYNSHDFKVVSDLVRKFTDSLRYYGLYALFVPEKHKSGAYHLHGLCSKDLKPLLVDSGHRHNDHIIYNLPLWRYGFSNITKVTNTLAVEKYVTKYTTKELLNDTLFQHRYFVLNLSQADMIKLNLFNHKELYKELLANDLVYYCNTDGRYNRCTYTEIKNDEKVLHIIEKSLANNSLYNSL